MAKAAWRVPNPTATMKSHLLPQLSGGSDRLKEGACDGESDGPGAAAVMFSIDLVLHFRKTKGS